MLAAVSTNHRGPRRDGLRVCRHPVLPPWEMADGSPLALPAEILLACARDLQLLDLVVLIDAALAAGECSYDDVLRIGNQRRRGAPALRQAVRHADARWESAWETLLRMLHVVCDIPVEPQYDVRDDDGSFLGTADLWLTDTNALREYDGSDHLERRRHRKDLQRERRLGNGAWLRRGYTSHEVVNQGVTILRDADLSLGRPHRPERIRAWHALLARSLFTPSGTELFRRRIGLALGMRLHAGRPDDAA